MEMEGIVVVFGVCNVCCLSGCGHTPKYSTCLICGFLWVCVCVHACSFADFMSVCLWDFRCLCHGWCVHLCTGLAGLVIAFLFSGCELNNSHLAGSDPSLSPLTGLE